MTDVVPLDPPWQRSLFAVLDRTSYQITHGGAVRLQGYVWAPEGEAFSPAARRQGEPGRALHEGADRRPAGADDEITFPSGGSGLLVSCAAPFRPQSVCLNVLSKD